MENPGLFGIRYSNRDFTQKSSWGKNQFNSAFPAALACYMNSKQLKANYLYLHHDSKIDHTEISIEELFKIDPTSDNIFFAFENQYTPYQPFVVGNIPGIDLVIQDRNNGKCLSGLEIKLTALPDHTTCDYPENMYGCEIVIRPDTIVYLACSIVQHYKNTLGKLSQIIGNRFNDDRNWSDAQQVIPLIAEIVKVMNDLMQDSSSNQTPFILQPIWKTQGKSPKLSENCLDIFVWSDIAFTKFITSFSENNQTIKKLSRQNRTMIWLFKMIYDFSKNKRFDFRKIIDELSYNTKNDKAFSASGHITYPYMKSESLTQPRIKKQEIKNIILGEGQKLLSPERRFDAIIFNSEGIFD